MSNRIHLICNNIIWFIESFTWKKDSTVVVMDAWFGQKFADNPRYLFQYLSENKKELGLTHVVWVTRNAKVLSDIREMGYEAYMLDSEESIKYHKLAKYHICNNAPNSSDSFTGEIAGRYSYRAKRINLEHGIGIKGVNYAANTYKDKKKRHPFLYKIKEKLHNYKWFRALYLEQGGWGDSFYLSTSKANSDILHRYFLLPYDHYIESDYPRNHVCLKMTRQENDVIKCMERHKYTVLYLPTFRTGTDHFNFSNLANNVKDLLEKRDILWIQKPHSADEHVMKGSTNENIINLDSNFDINVLLPHITILVTDYSSVSMDGIYHKKPILYFVPDYNEYLIGDRGFVIEPDNYMAGPLIYTVKELKEALISYIDNPSLAFDEHYLSIREIFWRDGITYEDIWNALK